MRKLIAKLYSKTRKTNSRGSTSLPETACPQLVDVHTVPDPANLIIVLHGHGGHFKDSWSHQVSGCFWLRDLLSEIFRASHIMSFAYSKTDEDTLGAKKIAVYLTDEVNKIVGERSVIWIAHSFGGSLLKGMLSMNRDLVSRTKAILFFGVPKEAGWKNVVIGIDATEMSAEMKSLRDEVLWLEDVENEFKKVLEDMPDIYWFAESGGGVRNAITSSETVTNVILLKKTHGEMIKYTGMEDENWIKVEKVLTNLT